MHSEFTVAMVTVVVATSDHERRRRAAGAALSGGLRSPKLCGGRSSIGEPWCDLEMAGEGDRGLQTCSKAEQTIGAMGEDSEDIGVLLESMRSSGNDRSCVLVTGATSLIRSLPEKKKKRRR